MKDDIREFDERVLSLLRQERRRERRRLARIGSVGLAVLLLAGTGIWASTALAAGANCVNGFVCFSAGDPAVADDINLNFKTIKVWIESKVGDVDNAANASKIPVNDVGGSAGSVTGGLLIDEGPVELRIDGNEVDADGQLLLNAVSREVVKTGGVLEVQGPDIELRADSTKWPGRGDGGIALAHVANDELHVNYNGGFSGGTTVGGDLTVSGNLKSWPEGSYCILRKGGSCPAGFSGTGNFELDVSSTYTDYSGDLGDISFNVNKDPRIYVCCR